VAALVGVFREVWRVLRDDGTLWLNLGDSYAPNWSSIRPAGGAGFKEDQTRQRWTRIELPPKNLVGIPWRVAFALQADGWYLRSDIIWAKPNPMPESVTDRPTKAHEYVFLLTKRERYYYDAEAIAEKLTMAPHAPGNIATGRLGALDGSVREPERVWGANGTRNARSVWTINPKPYADAHFATMPEKLAERCILAGSKPGDLVLDPFGGSGTTVRVARRFNRRGVMLDLNPAYLDLAEARTSELQPSLLHLSDEASA
jgi:DNA modification methylase